MGSVIVSWSGSCPDQAVRGALISALEPIARLSHSYFDQPPAVEFFDERVDGGVVCQEVGEKSDVAVPIHDEDEDDSGSSLGFELRVAGPHNTPVPVAGPLYSVPSVELHGIAFRLYDGRGLYPDEDVLSFVFATFAGDPVPFSRMVRLLPAEQREGATRTAVRDAACCLLGPEIHLRYYCEQWVNLLLGIIKYYFVPDLDWWAYTQCPGYSELQEILSDADGDRVLADHAFAVLAAELRTEIDSSSDQAAAIKSFWDSVRS
jgi:hypothetical protein